MHFSLYFMFSLVFKSSSLHSRNINVTIANLPAWTEKLLIKTFSGVNTVKWKFSNESKVMFVNSKDTICMARIRCQVLVPETERDESTKRSQTEEEILSREGKRVQRHWKSVVGAYFNAENTVGSGGGTILFSFSGRFLPFGFLVQTKFMYLKERRPKFYASSCTAQCQWYYYTWKMLFSCIDFEHFGKCEGLFTRRLIYRLQV